MANAGALVEGAHRSADVSFRFDLGVFWFCIVIIRLRLCFVLFGFVLISAAAQRNECQPEHPVRRPVLSLKVHRLVPCGTISWPLKVPTKTAGMSVVEACFDPDASPGQLDITPPCSLAIWLTTNGYSHSQR